MCKCMKPCEKVTLFEKGKPIGRDVMHWGTLQEMKLKYAPKRNTIKSVMGQTVPFPPKNIFMP